jgi:hypothetical protein
MKDILSTIILHNGLGLVVGALIAAALESHPLPVIPNTYHLYDGNDEYYVN